MQLALQRFGTGLQSVLDEVSLAPLPGGTLEVGVDSFHHALVVVRRHHKSQKFSVAAPIGIGGEPPGGLPRFAHNKGCTSAFEHRTPTRGRDLGVVVRLACAAPADVVLDVSMGAGHTALARVPHVARAVVTDPLPEMLAAA